MNFFVGMKDSLSHLLELAPTKKVLFSSDCHSYPETFFLASYFGRRVLFDVLKEMVEKEDLNVEECIDIARDILQRNGRKLYFDK